MASNRLFGKGEKWCPLIKAGAALLCSNYVKLQKLLEVLHEKLPKMSLIASDFSFLPDVKVPGERAPLVSTKVCSLFPLLTMH